MASMKVTVVDLTETDDEDDINDWRKKINPFPIYGHLYGSCFHFLSLDHLDRQGNLKLQDDDSDSNSNKQAVQQDFVSSEESVDTMESENENYSEAIPYYVEFFRHIIKTAEKQKNFKSFFTDVERNQITSFENLEQQTQELYIRLFQRKRCWFRESKIKYDGINAETCLTCLINQGLFFNESKLQNIEDALELLTASEVKKLAADFKIGKKCTSKASILSFFKKNCKSQKTLFGSKQSMDTVILNSTKKTLGRCVKINEAMESVFRKMIILFQMFSNLPTDGNILYHLLQVKTRQIVYPKFEFQQNNLLCLFENKEEFSQYVDLKDLETKFFKDVEANNLESALQSFTIAFRKFKEMVPAQSGKECPKYMQRFTSFYVLVRICRNAVSILEKLKRYQEAVDVIEILLSTSCLQPKHRGKLWERKIIDTERHLHQPQKALEYNEMALGDQFVRGHYQYTLKQRLEKTQAKNQGVKPEEEVQLKHYKKVKINTLKGAAVLDTTSSNRAVFMSSKASGSVMSHVEQFVLEYYKDQGYIGVHDEGSVMMMLYFLLFWDIIFKSKLSTFLNEYQTEPLDFRTDEFYSIHKEQLDSRINFIYSATKEEIQNQLLHSWDENHGSYVFGVNWSIITKSQAVDVAVSVKPLVLGGIFEIYSKDLTSRRSGFPDLIMWKKDGHSCKIIEVKGPGDKLSANQIVWLDILKSLGADVSVCRVTGVGGKRKFINNEEESLEAI